MKRANGLVLIGGGLFLALAGIGLCVYQFGVWLLSDGFGSVSGETYLLWAPGVIGLAAAGCGLLSLGYGLRAMGPGKPQPPARPWP